MNTEINANRITPDWLGIVAAHVRSLKFGAVTVTVHESRVVQIEKTEKVRLDKSERKDGR